MDKRDELLEEALKLINKYSITAYDISQGTGISAVGIQKIINGESKRPLERTLETITSYIKQKYISDANSHDKNEGSEIKNKPHDEQMAILHKDILELRKENNNLSDKLDDTIALIELYLSPIAMKMGISIDQDLKKKLLEHLN
ncbi:hypothetical protein JOE44_001986 [Chryseobacterium sp. PvR013]|uniref:hypothetical protein n=1 Tax=Chryseobacterium sp. PvR013 TaxID=2806595 RepID=UPI001AE9F8A5|nr:hypothetical protein [Chryseobacterium sp. PvR013]MBP1165102.1 hypothetical protein [Chryseobacterium sp. PvR013]